MANLESVRKLAAAVLVMGLVATPAPQAGGAAIIAENCNRESVADLVRAFVRAYNSGNTERLDRLWAQEPDFEWYSVSPDERERDDAYDRDSLLPYFERRHRLNDRLRLRSMRVGPPNEQGTFGIAYRLRRDSDQRAARGRYHGKASAKEATTSSIIGDSTTTRCLLFVWSMGRRER